MQEYKKKNVFSYAIGVYPAIELLKYRSDQVQRMLVHSKGSKNDGVKLIDKICLEKRIKVEVASGEIDKISQSRNCYAVGVFNKYQSPISDGNHLVLVSPEDIGNLGTIIRTMLAFDCINLAIIKPAIDIFYPKTIRASMGAVFQINYSYFDCFDDYRKQYLNKVFVFVSRNGMVPDTNNITPPYSLVFGSESAGLPANIIKQGSLVTIPFSGKVDSLNLAVAAGIGLAKAYQG